MLLDASIRQEYGNAYPAIAGIRQFVIFGSSVGLISESNAEAIRNEIAGLNEMIVGLSGNADLSGKIRQLPDLDVAGLFTKSEKDFKKAAKHSTKDIKVDPATPAISAEPVEHAPKDDNPQLVTSPEPNEGVEDGEPPLAPSPMRQKQIVERIRQMGDCRMKDLQDYFPGVSERTLRYDLQELIGEGTVERHGFGPSVFYRLPEVKPAAPTV
jgi:hypothetical protein